MSLFTTVITLLLINCVSSSSFITISALGRTAHLGYLYNEQTGQLGSFSIFQSPNLPNNSILTTEIHSTFTEAQVTSTYAEKLQLLNIDANTGANILSGLVNHVKGSARILKVDNGNQNDGEDDLTGILLYHYHSLDQDLQIFSQNLKELYNMDLINQPGHATHLVTGIVWGLNVAVTFKKGISSSPSTSKTQVRHELEEEFEALREISPETEERENSKNSNFTMRAYSDSALPLGENPRNWRELQEIRNQIPLVIKTTNGGKGVPIQYKLTPLSTIRKYLNVTGHSWPLAQEVSESALRKVFLIFNEISTTEQQLRNLQVKLESNSNCLHQNTRDQLRELITNVTEFKKNFEGAFQTTLLSIRAGNETLSELSVLANSFRRSDLLGNKMRRKLAEEFRDALLKIEFCNNLKDLNPEIQIFGSVGDLSSKIFQNWKQNIYVLFYKSEYIRNNRDAFFKDVNIFLSLSKGQNSQLFAVDCDFDFEQCESVRNTTVRQFFNGVVQDLDLLGQETILRGQDYFGGTQDAPVNSTFQWNPDVIQTLRDEINKLKHICNPNICKNGGTCLTDGKTFTCQCPPNYTGNTCEMDMNECSQYPSICQNGGTCNNKHGSYSCVCPSGFDGLNCEINIDDCSNATCLNGGTCHDRVGHFLCECLPEFWGRTCSEPASIQCTLESSSLSGSGAGRASRISDNRSNNKSNPIVVTLGCGGLISLPPQGNSILLEYNSNETQSNTPERCLWTLDSTRNGRRYENVTLRVTVLCDGFWLSLHRNRQDRYNRQSALTSHFLQKDIPLEVTSKGFYLSFTSDQSTAGQHGTHHGFVVGIEVIGLTGGRTRLGKNYFYRTSPASFAYGPYSDYEQVSIGISPSSSPSITFKVHYSDIDNNNNNYDNCNSSDALNIYEIRESEVISKGRLCGRNRAQPLSFTTAYPILAIFTSDHTNAGRGFQMSWK